MTKKLRKILVADDDADDLELIEEAIRNSEPGTGIYKVKEGGRVLKFLDALADEELPCLVVIDYNMPEMNGPQLLEELNRHSRYRDIPKVMLSTSGALLYKTECKDKGALAYFVKPGTLQELDALAKKMLVYCAA